MARRPWKSKGFMRKKTWNNNRIILSARAGQSPPRFASRFSSEFFVLEFYRPALPQSQTKIFLRTLHRKPGNNPWVWKVLHARYQAEGSSLSGYTKTRTVSKTGVLALSSRGATKQLSSIRYAVNGSANPATWDPTVQFAGRLTRSYTALRALWATCRSKKEVEIMHHVWGLKDGLGE